jgi:protein-S-isoprenylcysteine O-methyltransferase Ste14
VRRGLELRIPPVAVWFVAVAAMYLLDRAWPAAGFTLPGRAYVAVAVFALGLALGLAGVWTFRVARTTVNPLAPEQASSVVTTGVYRRTRNPMYLGLLLGLVAWACWLQSLPSLIVLPAFVAYMNAFQIGPEERALRGSFGESYVQYCRRVRRWL